MITVNNKHQLEWKEGMTVENALKTMKYDYSLISVHINEKYVPDDEYHTTTIPNNASVAIMHLAHGG